MLEVPDDLTDSSIYIALNRFTLLPALEDRKNMQIEDQVIADHTRHTKTDDAAGTDDEGGDDTVSRFNVKAEKKKYKAFLFLLFFLFFINAYKTNFFSFFDTSCPIYY